MSAPGAISTPPIVRISGGIDLVGYTFFVDQGRGDKLHHQPFLSWRTTNSPEDTYTHGTSSYNVAWRERKHEEAGEEKEKEDRKRDDDRH